MGLINQTRKLEPTAIGGTVASLVAFALMGWVVTALMWRPLGRTELESLQRVPEIAPESAPESSPHAPPQKPRKTNSQRTLTA